MVVVVLGNVASRAPFPWVGGPTTTTRSSTSAAATAVTGATSAAPDARSASHPKAKAAVGQDLKGGGEPRREQLRLVEATAGSGGAGDGGGDGGGGGGLQG